MIGLMMLAVTSAANPETADALLESCRTPRADACVRYVTGSVETYLALGPDKKDFCLPRGIVPKEMVAAFLSWMKAHPDNGSLDAPLVVFAAMQDRYRCSAGH